MELTKPNLSLKYIIYLGPEGPMIHMGSMISTGVLILIIYLGPEGPMIHMGSMIGAGVSQFQSKTLGLNLSFFTRFR